MIKADPAPASTELMVRVLPDATKIAGVFGLAPSVRLELVKV